MTDTYFDYIHLHTRGCDHVINITDQLQEQVNKSKIRSGQVLAFVPGSTGALSTVEFEPGLLEDLPEFFESIIPKGKSYHHNATWGDGNGHSHVRATLVGPSLTIPLAEGNLILGTWQQVVFLEFDNRNRDRRIAVQILGTRSG